MTGATEIPTMEENIQIPTEQIQKTDTSQAEVVERGDNTSGGISSFQKELSKAEQLFSEKESGRIQGPALEGGTIQESDPFIENGARTGHDSEEVKTAVTENSVRSSDYWNTIRNEGVPIRF
jgi:hypothetical protein